MNENFFHLTVLEMGEQRWKKAAIVMLLMCFLNVREESKVILLSFFSSAPDFFFYYCFSTRCTSCFIISSTTSEVLVLVDKNAQKKQSLWLDSQLHTAFVFYPVLLNNVRNLLLLY